MQLSHYVRGLAGLALLGAFVAAVVTDQARAKSPAQEGSARMPMVQAAQRLDINQSAAIDLAVVPHVVDAVLNIPDRIEVNFVRQSDAELVVEIKRKTQ